MIPAPIPAYEAERLADLRALQVLDTPAEQRFDRIVRLAQQIFEVPIAYIALIDEDRQWFKAKCGVSVDETGREVSFCGHAILQDRLLIVPDARLDFRFADNPLVTGDPYVRFYAGCPLAGPRGYNIGTLCLADREPRTLDEDEQRILEQLAAMTEEQLQLVDLVTAQRDLLDTQTQLLTSQARLAAELRDAEAYIRSLLPRPLSAGPVRTQWIYESSSQLGGDLFGYHALDDRRTAVYLLDVCGHGVGASLLASSVHTALRSHALPECDFGHPGQVLDALDRAFPMSAHNDKFFTIWYGVYDSTSRELRYATAGHHPAVMFNCDQSAPVQLGSPSLMIGILNGRPADDEGCQVPAGARMYLFSDGVFEIFRGEKEILGLEGLQKVLCGSVTQAQDRLKIVRQTLLDWTNGHGFPDDFSLVEFEFEA